MTGALSLTVQEATRRARADETILAVYGSGGLRLYIEADWWAAEIYAARRPILDWATGERAEYDREPRELVFIDEEGAGQVRAAVARAGLPVSPLTYDKTRGLHVFSVLPDDYDDDETTRIEAAADADLERRETAHEAALDAQGIGL